MAKPGPKPLDPKDYIEAIELWLGSGKFLAEYSRQPGNPGITVIHKWMTSSDEIRERIARARERGAEALFEQNLDIIDEMPPCDDNGRTDSAWVAWQKNRVWARMEMLKRIDPKKYGDKVEQTQVGADGGPVRVQVVFGAD